MRINGALLVELCYNSDDSHDEASEVKPMHVGTRASTDVEATVDRCRELGVDRVFLGSFPGYEENGYPDPGSLRDVKERLEENGLEVPSAIYWFAKWPPRPWRSERSSNPDVLLNRDRRCIDAMLRTIEIFGEIGLTSVLYYVNIGKPTDPAKEEECWERLIDVYRELISVAEASGIGIGTHSLHRLLPNGVREWAVAEGVRLEDFGDFRADAWGGPFLLGTHVELRRLVNEVPSSSNGVTLCTGMDIAGGDVLSLVREFGGKIHFCQLRNHTERWPAGQELALDEGRLDIPLILAALKEVGYQGMLYPEHLGKRSYPGEDLAAKAVAYLKSELASLERV